jgi:UDP-2,3-diacylglucosamine pyrophosphatase LpxH
MKEREPVMKMRRFAMTVWALVLCLLMQLAATQATAQVGPRYQSGKEPPRIIAGPYLQSPGDNTMTIMWITDKNSTAWVEYGAKEPLDHKAVSTHDGLIDANTRIHKVTLSGLTPGTQYEYRVCSTEIVDFGPYSVTFGTTQTLAPATFKTLSKQMDKVSVAVMNDLHQSTPTMQTLWNLAKSAPPDLVFFNGDSLDYLESENQIVRNLLQPITELFAQTTPLMYVRGNHETRGKFARMLGNYLATPNGKYYYSFDAGPVHFVVLDCGEDKEDSHPAYSGLTAFDAYRDEEKQWLAQEIESKPFRQARFRVVFMHMPPFSSRREGSRRGAGAQTTARSVRPAGSQRPAGTQRGGTADCFEKFAPLLNKGKVDLLITAHTHRYAYLEPKPGEHDYPMANGGGPNKGRATLIRVDADKSRIELTMTRDDGEVLEKREIRRR